MPLNTQASKKETIYFMNSAGQLDPYMTVIRKSTGGKYLDGNYSEKGKKSNEALLAKYIPEPAFRKLRAYARSNNLAFEDRTGFLKIMEYYKSQPALHER